MVSFPAASQLVLGLPSPLTRHILQGPPAHIPSLFSIIHPNTSLLIKLSPSPLLWNFLLFLFVVSNPSYFFSTLLTLGLFFHAPCFSSDSLRVLQINAEGPCAKSVKLFHFVLFLFLLAYLYLGIQPQFYFIFQNFVQTSLHSDYTHFCSGSPSLNDMHGDSSIIIVVIQGLSFFTLLSFLLAFLLTWRGHFAKEFLCSKRLCSTYLLFGK